MNLIVTTNGLRLDQPAITELHTIGPLDVRVSFEGGPELHEHVRGRHTYQPAIDALARLIRSGIPATARLTLCQGAQHDLPILFADLSAAGVRNVKVALAKRAGRAATPAGQHLVIDNLDPAVVAWLETLSSQHGLRLQLSADDFAIELADGPLSKLRDIHRPNCGAGFETCHINPRGEVLACAAIPNLSLGSLQARSFTDIWESAAANAYRSQATKSTSRRLCDTLADHPSVPLHIRRPTRTHPTL